ncbi:MAG TPA: hypothetical protein VGG33_28685, partial [Polyangia bacterium]
MTDVPAGAITAVVPLPSRGVAVAGRYRGVVDLGQGPLDRATNAFVAVFDARGHLEWSQTFSTGLATGVDHGRDPGLVRAPGGDLVMRLSGLEPGVQVAARPFGLVVRLTSAGQRRWERRWPDIRITSHVATDTDTWLATERDLVRLDAGGTEQARTKPEALAPMELQLDPTGGIYLLGVAEKLPAVARTYAVERRSLQGERIWRRTFGGRGQPFMHMATNVGGDALALIGQSDGPVDLEGEGALVGDTGGSFNFLYVVTPDGRVEGKALVNDVAWADSVAWTGNAVLVLGSSGAVPVDQQSLNLVAFDRRGGKTKLTRFPGFVEARGQLAVLGQD